MKDEEERGGWCVLRAFHRAGTSVNFDMLIAMNAASDGSVTI